MVSVLVRAADAEAVALMDWSAPRAARNGHLEVVAPGNLAVDGLGAEEQRAAEAAARRRARVARAAEVGHRDLDASLMEVTRRSDNRSVDRRRPLDRTPLVVADRLEGAGPVAIARDVERAPEDNARQRVVGTHSGRV